MNSNMIKPEKFDHLHLVYYITVPLKNQTARTYNKKSDTWVFPFNNIINMFQYYLLYLFYQMTKLQNAVYITT